jgi:hypothetical protein
MSREITIEKDRIQEYLEFAPTKVNLMQFVKWLEIQGNGLFKIDKPFNNKKQRF